MTYEEAIESLEYLKSKIKCHYPVEYQNDHDDSIEKAIYAIKKQIPKNPEKNDWGEQTDVCPNCHSYLDTFQVYCPDCGQKINWEDHE